MNRHLAWIFAPLVPSVVVLWSCGSSNSTPPTDTPASTVDAEGGDTQDTSLSPETSAPGPDASAPDDGPPSLDALEGSTSEDASPPLDALEGSAPDDASTDADALADGATYRNSLSICWNDSTCQRALAISHGGDWKAAGPPYDSNTALLAAYDHGADGVKIDVRFTKDVPRVAVISHSSPIELYESVNCYNKKIEEMTADEVTSCTRFPSGEKFQRLDEVLDLLRGKLVVQLCVKVNTEFGLTMSDVLAKGAQDFAFIEANTGDFSAISPLPGADQLYYVVNVGSTVTEVDTILGWHNPRIIMIELDPSVALNGMATTKLHPGGVRAFTYDNSSTATQQNLKALFEQGFDVVSSNLTAPAVQARIQVNTSRGINPP